MLEAILKMSSKHVKNEYIAIVQIKAVLDLLLYLNYNHI